MIIATAPIARRSFLRGVAASLFATPAFADWKPQYASAPQDVQDWYRNAKLTEPAKKRLGFTSCCDSSEVVKTKFKVDRATGQDVWLYLKDGKYEPIPPDIIHWGESAPDGRPTLFVLNHDVLGQPAGTPTCFYPPPGGM